MATTAVERLFVDTNVLVYATNVDSPWQGMRLAAAQYGRLQPVFHADPCPPAPPGGHGGERRRDDLVRPLLGLPQPGCGQRSAEHNSTLSGQLPQTGVILGRRLHLDSAAAMSLPSGSWAQSKRPSCDWHRANVWAGDGFVGILPWGTPSVRTWIVPSTTRSCSSTRAGGSCSRTACSIGPVISRGGYRMNPAPECDRPQRRRMQPKR
jgi:hypothetical protein